MLRVTLLLPAALLPPVGNGLAGVRWPSSDKHQYFFFWTVFFSASRLSSLFCSVVFFPLSGFVIPFSRLAHRLLFSPAILQSGLIIHVGKGPAEGNEQQTDAAATL